MLAAPMLPGDMATIRMLEVIAVMAGMTLVGVALRRLGWMGTPAAHRMTRAIINVTLPVGVFVSLHAADLDAGALRAPVVATLVTVALMLLGWFAGGWLRLSRQDRASFVLAATFGNTMFMGYPVVVALLGEEALPQAVVTDQLGPGALVITVGAFFAAHASRSGGGFSWWAEFRHLLMFPPLVALAVAVGWRLMDLPHLAGPAASAARLVGASTVPLAMVSFGLLLNTGSLRQALLPAAAVTGLRLFVSPALTLLFAHLLALDPRTTASATLQLAMPTMMFTLVLALRYDLVPKKAAAYIFATMVASIVSLPLWVALLGRLAS